jgi:hypothetical protein
MTDAPALFMAITGTAFLVAGYASAGIEPRAADFAPKAPIAGTVATKGDRLDRARPAAERIPVAVVEVVGVSQVAVVLRSRAGDVLYSSDPVSNTTVVTKNADLPMVTLSESASVPVTQSRPSAPVPARTQEGNQGGETPAAPAPRKPRTIGCESEVSPLARGSAGREPSRCVVELDIGRVAS